MSKIFGMNKENQKNPDEMNESGVSEEEKNTGELSSDEVSNGKEASEPRTEEDQLILDQQAQISELENRVNELSESNLRKTAELDNARKRMQRERVQLFETSKASAIEYFLPVYDDLQRILDALDEDDEMNVKAIKDGVELVADKFREALKRYNVERIDETGVPFDVDLHDALMRKKPEDENTGSNVVLQVLENGYKMGDRTIRHAKVIVSE